MAQTRPLVYRELPYLWTKKDPISGVGSEYVGESPGAAPPSPLNLSRYEELCLYPRPTLHRLLRRLCSVYQGQETFKTIAPSLSSNSQLHGLINSPVSVTFGCFRCATWHTVKGDWRWYLGIVLFQSIRRKGGKFDRPRYWVWLGHRRGRGHLDQHKGPISKFLSVGGAQAPYLDELGPWGQYGVVGDGHVGDKTSAVGTRDGCGGRGWWGQCRGRLDRDDDRRRGAGLVFAIISDHCDVILARSPW